ncbi:MFS transporter [Streptomyces sp. NPDC001675]
MDTTERSSSLHRGGPGLAPAGLSWVLNAYTLAFGGLLLLGGRLGDTYGRLRVFGAGLALFTAASLLGGVAQTPALLIVARAAQGTGAPSPPPVSSLALLTPVPSIRAPAVGHSRCSPPSASATARSGSSSAVW